MHDTTNAQEITIRCPKCAQHRAFKTTHQSGYAVVKCGELASAYSTAGKERGCDAIFAAGWNPRVKVYRLVENVDATTKGDPKMLKLQYITTDDNGRPVYQDEAGRLYKDINPGKGKLSLHTALHNDIDGEPDYPLRKPFEILDSELCARCGKQRACLNKTMCHICAVHDELEGYIARRDQECP